MIALPIGHSMVKVIFCVCLHGDLRRLRCLSHLLNSRLEGVVRLLNSRLEGVVGWWMT